MVFKKKIVPSLVACAFATGMFVAAPAFTDWKPMADQAQAGKGKGNRRANAFKARKPKRNRTQAQYGWERWNDSSWRKHNEENCPYGLEKKDNGCLPPGIASKFE